MFIDRPVGIDLGTTNSEIALLDPSERDLVVYQDRFGRSTFPSALAWDEARAQLVVGREARRAHSARNPVVQSIKRKMGQATTVQVGPHALSPEAISAEILRALQGGMREHLKERAQADVDVRVDRAVITVPAYFDAPQVEATRDAGHKAGLTVLGVLQEPTAAAIYHTWKRKLSDGCFLVYDLGGGTFDVSILRCLGGEYQVLAIDGDNYLGGDDLDRRFAEVLRQQLSDAGYALDLDPAQRPDDHARFLDLVHLAQEAKEALSTRDVVHLSRRAALRDRSDQPVDIDLEIGRRQWEAAVEDLVMTTLACCDRALAMSEDKAGVRLGDIDHVVLVGGSTRVPLVAAKVEEHLCRGSAPLATDVDTCVALGAAIAAAQLGGFRFGDTNAQVLVTSPLVGQRDTLKLRFDIERAPPETRAAELRADDAVLGQVELDALPQRGCRLEVPLGDEAENRAELVFRAQDDSPVAALPMVLYRGDVRPRASALSQPSVIAKDVAIEVVKAGRRERHVLLPAGTGLPARADHTFYTADQSGAVVLRMLQNRLPIKTLMLDVGQHVPLGTPVQLSLRVDDTMRMEARAEVAGQELWAQLEAAKTAPPQADEVEALLIRAEASSQALWGHEARFVQAQVDTLVAGIREVLSIDPDKLAALCARLDHLLAEFVSGDVGDLSPPLHHFEFTVDQLRRVIYRASGGVMGIATDAWEVRIEDLVARALAAHGERDSGAWRRAYNEAQALLETASEEEFTKMKVDDPAYLTQRLLAVTAHAKQLERDLADFVPSSNQDVRQRQEAEVQKLKQQLEDRVLERLASLDQALSGDALRHHLDRMSQELDRIESTSKRLPALGLVSERGKA